MFGSLGSGILVNRSKCKLLTDKHFDQIKNIYSVNPILIHAYIEYPQVFFVKIDGNKWSSDPSSMHFEKSTTVIQSEGLIFAQKLACMHLLFPLKGS